VAFREDVTEFAHLAEGMVLEGVVTNVTRFGAFVDVGVHHDGLLHVSEMSTRFVRDPAEVVKVGDRLKVKVIKIDAERQRVSLSLKQLAEPARRPPPATGRAPERGAVQPSPGRAGPPPGAPKGRPPGKGPDEPRGGGGGGAAPFNAIRIRPR
jgi:uncharacterized protein